MALLFQDVSVDEGKGVPLHLGQREQREHLQVGVHVEDDEVCVAQGQRAELDQLIHSIWCAHNDWEMCAVNCLHLLGYFQMLCVCVFVWSFKNNTDGCHQVE